jgi:hypothetical protein
VNWERSTIEHQHWLSWEELGLGKEYAESWRSCIDILKNNNVRFREVEDRLIWSLNPIGTYVAIIGYKALVNEGREGCRVL